MVKIFKIAILLILLHSCNNEQKIIQTITNDFPLIKGSLEEIKQNYRKCLLNFGKTRKLHDGRELIKFEISLVDIKQIEKLHLKNTISLLKNGYIIKIDASCQYNILFEKEVISRTFGVTRYSVCYKNITNKSPNIVEIVMPENVEILKHLDNKTSIVKIVEHFE